MTFEDAAADLSDALKESSSEVSDSIASVAQEVTAGTHGLMHDIAISDEVAAPDELEEQQPMAAQMVATPAMYGYQQQFPEELSYEPVLTRMQRLRA